jgi:hypothetical protein
MEFSFRFEAFTAVAIRITVFCYVMTLSMVDLYRRSWRQHVPPKRRQTFTGIYGFCIISYEIAFNIQTDVEYILN